MLPLRSLEKGKGSCMTESSHLDNVNKDKMSSGSNPGATSASSNWGSDVSEGVAGASHLDILRRGVNAWNEWRERNHSTKPDLTEASLIDAYLQQANLTEANLRGANLQGADLLGANLLGANLEDAKELTQAQIEQAIGDESTRLPQGLARPVKWASGARAGNLRGAANDAVAAEDQLGFAHYVDAFAQLIDSPDTKPPLTIGIYGSWGMGKSFLLKNIEWKLRDEKFQSRPQPPGTARRPEVHVVHFNAWEYSAAEVIWPGLVRKVLNKIEEPWSRTRRFLTKFLRNARRQTREFLGRLLLVALVLAIVFLVALWQFGTGVDKFLGDKALLGAIALTVVTVSGLVKLVSDTMANPLGQYVTALAEDSDYGKHIGYMSEIRKDLENLEERLRANKGRILIVVDDLDRCEPEKAVEVLQAINLLLNFESFIVCLGIDARIITAAVDKHYEGLLGDVGASGYEYLEKIVQIPFRIPQPSEEEIKAFISKQLGNPEPPSEDTEFEADSTKPPSEDTEFEADSTKPSSEDTEDPQAAAQVAFPHDELKGFQDVAPFLRKNPRHLKRLVNVYRLVRSLAAAKDERAILDKPAATIRWLVICAQWPYTSHAMLWQYDETLEEWDGDLPAADPLPCLFNQVSPRLSSDKQHKLDDPDLLRKLLEREEVRFTWEELQRIRQYTVNFNPAVESEMWALSAGEQPVDR
jgi:Cdc6-like AAA superfamily ATPase